MAYPPTFVEFIRGSPGLYSKLRTPRFREELPWTANVARRISCTAFCNGGQARRFRRDGRRPRSGEFLAHVARRRDAGDRARPTFLLINGPLPHDGRQSTHGRRRRDHETNLHGRRLEADLMSSRGPRRKSWISKARPCCPASSSRTCTSSTESHPPTCCRRAYPNHVARRVSRGPKGRARQGPIRAWYTGVRLRQLAS